MKMKNIILAVLLLMMALVSCREEPIQEDVILPEDPNKASVELRNLWKLVHGDNKIPREEARGELLKYIKDDMQKEHVEVWLGKPAGEHKTELPSFKEGVIAKYDCRLPEFEGTELEGTHLMTVVYEVREDGLRVVKVEGPHFPE